MLPPNNSTSAQRIRLHDRLKQGPVTTIEVRQELHIMHPAGRIRELRCAGCDIETEWCVEVTPEGNICRVAKYILLSEGGA